MISKDCVSYACWFPMVLRNTIRAAQHPTKGAGRLRCLPPAAVQWVVLGCFVWAILKGRKAGKKGDKVRSAGPAIRGGAALAKTARKKAAKGPRQGRGRG